MIFGDNDDKGIVLDGWNQKAITIGQDGYTLDDVLVHDTSIENDTLHEKLSLMGIEENHGLPIALGVIRDVEAPTYEVEQEKQLKEVQAKSPKQSFEEFIMNSGNVWEVE